MEKKEMEEMGKRFYKLVYELMESNVNSFSQDLGVSQTGLKQVCNGTAKPSSVILTPLAAKYPHISLRWLLTGKGAAIFNIDKIILENEKQQEINVLLREQNEQLKEINQFLREKIKG